MIFEVALWHIFARFSILSKKLCWTNIYKIFSVHILWPMLFSFLKENFENFEKKSFFQFFWIFWKCIQKFRPAKRCHKPSSIQTSKPEVSMFCRSLTNRNIVIPKFSKILTLFQVHGFRRNLYCRIRIWSQFF